MLERPLTKRTLGILMVAGGVLGFVGSLVVDLMPGGMGIIGPTQAAAMVGCVVAAIVGLTLIPLGDRPA
ncbi:MAG: hypothetical protein M5R40_13620 [Anaerolineae bacterium]|nr:hypothetical protein [Anaerolineae bacterium]